MVFPNITQMIKDSLSRQHDNLIFYCMCVQFVLAILAIVFFVIHTNSNKKTDETGRANKQSSSYNSNNKNHSSNPRALHGGDGDSKSNSNEGANERVGVNVSTTSPTSGNVNKAATTPSTAKSALTQQPPSLTPVRGSSSGGPVSPPNSSSYSSSPTSAINTPKVNASSTQKPSISVDTDSPQKPSSYSTSSTSSSSTSSSSKSPEVAGQLKAFVKGLRKSGIKVKVGTEHRILKLDKDANLKFKGYGFFGKPIVPLHVTGKNANDVIFFEGGSQNEILIDLGKEERIHLNFSSISQEPNTGIPQDVSQILRFLRYALKQKKDFMIQAISEV